MAGRMQQLWGIHEGDGRAAYENATADGLIALGWSEVNDLSRMPLKRVYIPVGLTEGS